MEDRERLLAELREAEKALSADLEATHRLLRLGSLFLRDGNVESVLGEIVDAAIAISSADFGNVQLLDRESGDLRIVAHRGFRDWWLEFWDCVQKGQGSCGTALERRERIIVEDVENFPVFAGPSLEAQRNAGVRACQSTPLYGRSGEPIGMLSTHYRAPGRPSDRALRLLDLLARQAADILERAQAERALEEANRSLIEADRRKNEFLGMLSHELRNPLATIHSHLYVLGRAEPAGEQARRAQAVIERQIGHMTRLIDDLLDVARITYGKVLLRREPLDLNELVQRTVEDLRGVFLESGVALEVIATPAEVRVRGDRARLVQVIGNLLRNAAKFTAPGGRATISVESDVASGGAVVRVRDTGRGIAPDVLPHVFEPFTQAETSLDREKGGLGLGLALVQGLIEMHGGVARAESDGPGQGATFTIVLPLDASGPEPATELAPSDERVARRVLLIEDHADLADGLRVVLELAGHEVKVAHGGREGIEAARVFAPDVVLCDIGLPEMDGYAVARAMRGDPQLRRLRLIALTGYARPDDVARAKEAGFDAHLTKPPDLQALRRILAIG